MKPTLLILAAGMGSRYGGLKQLDSVGPGGETIIDYSVFDAARAGFGKVVFVIRRDFEALFKKQVGARFESKIEVAYAYQALDALPSGFKVPEGREKPWGTGQAVLMAKDLIHGPFAMVNADDFYGYESFEIMARHLSTQGGYAMAGYRLKSTLSEHGTVSRAVCDLNPDDSLKRLREVLKIEKHGSGGRDQATGEVFSGEELVSMNFFGFPASFFPLLEAKFAEFLKSKGGELRSECYVPQVLDELIQDGKARVQVLASNASWFGVTYQEDKPLVTAGIRKLIESGLYPPSLK